MIKVENIDVWGFEHAIRGMRNPLQSHHKSDSYVCDDKHCGSCKQNPETRNCSQPDGIVIGENDLDLMKRLYKAGTEHRKYLRQIFVSMDITAPLYWWKEFDTYKVGTVANSCSTMHKIAAKEFELDDFSTDHLIGTLSDATNSLKCLDAVIYCMNYHRHQYISTKNKEEWWQMIQLLPSSYNQRRTVTMNYENVVTIIKQRSGHKLDEWNKFVDILLDLPYIKEIIN